MEALETEHTYVQSKVTPGFIPFSLGQPDASLLPADSVASALVCAANEVAAHPFALQYSKPSGPDRFRAELSHFLDRQHNLGERRGGVDPESVVMTPGNSMAIALLAQKLKLRNPDPHPCCIVESPSYFLAEAVLREAGLEPIAIAQGEQFAEDAVAVMRDRRARGLEAPAFIYVIPTFHNPTSSSLSPASRRALVDAAEEFGTYIISDEPYNMLSFAPKGCPAPLPLTLPEEDEGEPSRRVLSLGSFSKIIAPGLRLGWCHGHPETVRSLMCGAGAVVSGGGHSPLPALAVSELMATRAADEHVAMVRETLGARSEVLREALVKEGVLSASGAMAGAGVPSAGMEMMEMDAPLGGYFAWLRMSGTKEHRDEAWWDALDVALENERVTVTPGRRCVFGVAGEHAASLSSSSSCSYSPEARRALAAAAESATGARHSLRLSFAKVTEQECAEGARRLARALKRVIGRR